MAAVNLTKENLPFTNVNTRFQEKLRLKELKWQNGLNFTKRLNNIFSGKKKRISYRLYLMIVFSYQLRVETVVAILHWILYYGAVNMFIGFCIVTAIFQMPLMLLFTFLGMYCRKTFVEIWDCLPVMKGIAISVILLSTVDNVLDASYATLSFRFLFDIFLNPLPWTTCDFKGATEFCYPPYQNFTHKKYKDFSEDDCCGYGFEYESQNCTGKLKPSQSVSEFLTYNKVKYNFRGNNFQDMNLEWIIALGAFWMIIYFCVLLGMEKMKAFIAIFGVCGFGFPTLIYTLLSLMKFKIYEENRLVIHRNPLFVRQFWTNLVYATSKCATPGFIVYIASLAPDDSDPLKTAVLATLFRGFVLAMGFLGVSSFIGAYLEDYNARYKCIGGRGHILIFAVGTHLISTIPGHVLLHFLWFLPITFQALTLSLAHVLASIDSLADGIPYFSKHRGILTLVFILLSFSLNFIVATPHGFEFFYFLRRSSLTISLTLVFSLSLLGIVFIYGAHRLKNDYHFAFSRPISNYWIMLWKIDTILALTFSSPLLTGASICLLVTTLQNTMDHDTTVQKKDTSPKKAKF